MSDNHHSAAAQSASQVPYATFEPPTPESPQRPSPAPTASASRMTWGYWFVRGMFKLVIRMFMYDVVEVGQPPAPPPGVGILYAANHPNALLDGALLMAVADVPISFVAKATLFNLPIMGTLLRWSGAIPIHRAQDAPAASADGAPRTSSNKSAFSAISARLRQNGRVAIFPEGISHMQSHVMPLYTGIARMALDAVQGDDGVDVWVVAVGLNYTADGGRRFRSLATIEWSSHPLVVTKATREQLAAHGTDALLPEQSLDDMFVTQVAEALKAPDPNRAPPRPVDPVVVQMTQAIQSRLIAVTVNTPSSEDLWLAALARKVYLPTRVRFNFRDEHQHAVVTHVSPPSLCERFCGCSLNWAHHKAPLKFQATRAITRAYFSIVGGVKQDVAPEKGGAQDIAKQLHDDIKVYSGNLRSLGLADHFIALSDINGFIFFLLALTRFIWLCLTGPFVVAGLALYGPFIALAKCIASAASGSKNLDLMASVKVLVMLPFGILLWLGSTVAFCVTVAYYHSLCANATFARPDPTPCYPGWVVSLLCFLGVGVLTYAAVRAYDLAWPSLHLLRFSSLWLISASFRSRCRGLREKRSDIKQRLRLALHSDKVQPPINFVDWANSSEDENMSVWRALRHPLWSSAWGDA